MYNEIKNIKKTVTIVKKSFPKLLKIIYVTNGQCPGSHSKYEQHL